MRNLQLKDTFHFARAVRAAGLKSEVKKIIDSLMTRENAAKIIQDIGIETMLSVVEAFGDVGAEQAIYEVLSGPFEMTTEEIASLELADVLDGLDKMRHDPGIKNFLQRLSGLIGKD